MATLTPITHPQKFDKYILLYKIGKGTFGVVYKAQKENDGPIGNPTSGRFYAVKEVKNQDEGGEESTRFSLQTLREIKLLKELCHTNVVSLEDVIINGKQKLALVFEYGLH